jgi:hypothetical protein
MDTKYFHAFVVTVGLILGLGLGVAPTYTAESQVYAQDNTTEGNEEESGNAEDEKVTNQQVQELNDAGNKTAPGGEGGILMDPAQYEEDSKLLDRLLPILYQKIDINTIIAKADGKKLLEKVLPYLDVKVTTRVQQGPIQTAREFKLMGNLAGCSKDEVLIGGGYWLRGDAAFHGDAMPMASLPNTSGYQHIWYIVDYFSGKYEGTQQAYALCMKVKVGIMGEVIAGKSKVIPGKSRDLGIITEPGDNIMKGPSP